MNTFTKFLSIAIELACLTALACSFFFGGHGWRLTAFVALCFMALSYLFQAVIVTLTCAELKDGFPVKPASFSALLTQAVGAVSDRTRAFTFSTNTATAIFALMHWQKPFAALGLIILAFVCLWDFVIIECRQCAELIFLLNEPTKQEKEFEQ